MRLERLSTILIYSILFEMSIVTALPLYADVAQTTYSLVLCSGLDMAIQNLKSIELSDHSIGLNLLETNCVHINPCSQLSGNLLQVPMDTWVHGNHSALVLENTLQLIQAAVDGQKAFNYGSLEYARIPEGIVLQTCAPAFDIWRETGSIVCNEDTIKTIDTTSVRGCPRQSEFSLLDCMQPLQFDSAEIHLHWRAPTEIMHFGSKTWEEACNNTNIEENLIKTLCELSRQYSIAIPKAADIGSTSMIKYSFAENFGCHTSTDLLQYSEPHVLSQYTYPNKIIKCTQVENAVVSRIDDFTCDITCNTGFDKVGSECISQCIDWKLSCSHGEKHTATKMCDGITYYQCSECEKLPGQSTLSWINTFNIDQCVYAQCNPGFYSTINTHDCEPCDVNTYTNVSGKELCYNCNTLETGLYQTLEAQSSCTTCLFVSLDIFSFEHNVCESGQELVTDFARFLSLNDLYHQAGQNIQIETYLHQFCTNGYACLPCEKGTFVQNLVCLPCPLGTYQPNFASTTCFMCARGQNTTQTGTITKEECVCMPGFE